MSFSFRKHLFMCALFFSYPTYAKHASVDLLEDQANYVARDMFQLSGSADFPNGAWCWFQDPRAIVDVNQSGEPIMLVSSFSARDRAEYAFRYWGKEQKHYAKGDNDLYWMNLQTGKTGQVKIHRGLTQDDHNVGALSKLTDGRYLIAYADHGYERKSYFKTTLKPNDPTTWSEARHFTHGEPVTYSNLYRVDYENNEKTSKTKDGGTLINFSRAVGFDPNVVSSFDEGATWHYQGLLLGGPGRPYVRYAQGQNTVHFIASDQHPRDFNNSIYHGVTDGKSVFSSTGKIIDPDITDDVFVQPKELTLVQAGSPSLVAWPIDIHVDKNDHPYALYSAQINAENRGKLPGLEHRYYYARLVDNQWQTHEIAHAGSALYEWEQDYTGLAALDPNDPDYVVISTNAHPDTGEPLMSEADGQRHWELYEGRTQNMGKSWTWTALTQNSTVDNIRPIIPQWSSDKRVILWMRGSYITFNDYNTQIVGVIGSRLHKDKM